ncbi:FAS1 domain-containing protein [Parasitella parasitica]|nr:FAS1 domain-containing protein [Parasitella parasitica]
MLKTFIFPFLLLFNAVVALKTIIDALSEDEKFQTLLDHIQHLELVTLVNNLESGTLFAPDNEAFKKCQFEIDRSILLYHLLKNDLIIDNTYHGQLKETMYVRPGYLGPDSKTGQRMKITKDGKKTFVNQAKIIEKDIQVNNQTHIQVIDRVLQPPMSLGDSMIDRNKAVFNLMNSTDIIDLLRENRPFTVIVSKKENPLENFNTIETSYLESKYGKDDLSLFFKYAIIDKAIYIDEFNSGKTTYKSLSGDSLVVAADKDKKLTTVNDIPIVKTDIIAANGVIHEIDDTFKFNGIDFNTRKYLYGSNGTHMVELFDKYDSSHFIDQKELNYTFLIPPPDKLNQSLVSKSWLRYHIVQGSWPPENLIDDMLLQSQFKSSDLDDNYQRLSVYVEKENSITTFSRSVQFGKSRVIGDNIGIHDDIIYQISDPLLLPGDILGKLVVNLDLSTFLATLYASGVADEIKNTRGLTLFVPTNEAFQNLGLVAKYLVHSSAKSDLQTVLRYHAARSLLYYDDIKSQVHEVATLANSTLRVSQNQAGSVVIGRPEGNGMNENAAIVTHANTLVSNGVVHKISQVQIPNQVRISNQHLLVGIEASTMTQILTKANLLDKINQDNMVVLAPSDKAFAHVDLDVLFGDQYQLERVAKLHVIPTAWQDRWILSSENSKSRHDKSEYSTLLSDDDKVAIRENEKGELFVEVKNGGDNDRAHVTGLGRVSGGGGVIAIDTVLLPIRRGLFGLPIVWSIVVLLTIIIITGGILSIVGFFGYKVYSRRRLGYRPIFD